VEELRIADCGLNGNGHGKELKMKPSRSLLPFAKSLSTIPGVAWCLMPSA
jgi:hypothetical protein